MTGKKRIYGICFLVMLVTGCEGMAALFHGSAPEETAPVPALGDLQ